MLNVLREGCPEQFFFWSITARCVEKSFQREILFEWRRADGMLRNIDRMYYNFGYGTGYCHECEHFRRECWNKKAEKKVTGYDENGKEIIEYESFLACGLSGKPFPKEENQQNQISIDDLIRA